MGINNDFSATGEFIENQDVIAKKLKNIKALIFDWDGVFHSGYKKSNKESSFSEADSMGINMLRFSYFLKDNTIPFTAIITGENNETADYFAKREHFDEIFLKVKNKIEILDWLTQHKGFTNEEVLFVFDDILDMSIAKVCGLRFMVNRDASFMLTSYCKKNQLCDYITKNNAENHAIREISEVAISLMGDYDRVIEKRINYDEDYLNYLKIRNSIKTNSSFK
jgi:3-deoxy-D-manno-octulosonate 8-phosphate phosphatase (KDO 8-P phosphatase)